ncbi:hypothetical protein [Devosia sp.]|uniref:hypothetical protein n=1 Tax=Devosia sp. TaxID=1871048 RepID=UPI001B17D131|nr:hypothetical protein [Devosia sp.]MBO9589082.1 hypothetical protein [Devosia sp.]
MTVISMPVRTGDGAESVNLAVFFHRTDAAMQQVTSTISGMLESLTVDQLLTVEERIHDRYGYGPAATNLCDIVDEEICRRHIVKSPDGAA